MEKMVEPPPSEGDEATITAMSPLAAVGQYMSTNSAKSTFLRNTVGKHSMQFPKKNLHSRKIYLGDA